jgi:site-specific recombinase XerD
LWSKNRRRQRLVEKMNLEIGLRRCGNDLRGRLADKTLNAVRQTDFVPVRNGRDQIGSLANAQFTDYVAAGRCGFADKEASRHDSPCRKPDDLFFVGRNSKRIPIHMVERAFKQVRKHAGLQREGGPRCQPRLLDLRHTTAVHRLTSWYRDGKDVQKLLPQLSVYMGHARLAATQAYLSMTPNLLHQANLRFERYAIREGGNE